MSKANKTLVRRFYDAANRGALNDFDDFVAPDFVDHNALPGQSPGVQGLKESIGAFRAGFPDIHATIMDLIAEGDKVVVRTAARGTHTGPLLGVPPTGKRAEFMAVDIWRVKEGRLAEAWHIEELLQVMIQLGVVPAPSA